MNKIDEQQSTINEMSRTVMRMRRERVEVYQALKHMQRMLNADRPVAAQQRLRHILENNFKDMTV